MKISEQDMLTISPEAAHGLQVGFSTLWYDSSLTNDKLETARLWTLIERFGKIASPTVTTDASPITLPIEEGDRSIIITAANVYIGGILDLKLRPEPQNLIEATRGVEELLSFLVEQGLS